MHTALQRRHAPPSVRSTANRSAISPYQRCLNLRGSEKCTCFGYIGLLWTVSTQSSSLHATWFMKSNWSFNFTNGRCWSKLRLLPLVASNREQPNIFVKPNTSAKYNVSIYRKVASTKHLSIKSIFYVLWSKYLWRQKLISLISNLSKGPGN